MNPRNPQVSIQTELGEIVLELFSAQAPRTVANFLRYVDEHRYRGATFYRTVRMDNQAQSPIKIEVIQGGLGMGEHPAKLPPITLETTAQTGLRHQNGTVSMARLEPNSAQSEFSSALATSPSSTTVAGATPMAWGLPPLAGWCGAWRWFTASINGPRGARPHPFRGSGCWSLLEFFRSIAYSKYTLG
ncbi:peptidyl-prolyl cis-trans isomerase cyclophilin type [Meiothermus ruber DSM 1279]|uniref:peptidylprolyl isomerase n=1 Tax=Meiothermus ruber (strain ATCC 35948 / DSM 1279 / VKM B-1258 / 21) TaxID=504728 RepID=A0A806DD91_MEIRD|nr:peptidyl-prolyl cis-trans isomerase cyclophilin type [Meiothermus ruber DSM 1279]